MPDADRLKFRLAYEALLHANHLLYELPPGSDYAAVHARVDSALQDLNMIAQEWGCEDFSWMSRPPAGVGETGSG